MIKGLLLVWLVFAFAAMGAATEAGSVVIDAVYQSEILQWLYENNLILTILLSLFMIELWFVSTQGTISCGAYTFCK